MARYKPYNLDQRKLIPVALEAQILPGSFEHTLITSMLFGLEHNLKELLLEHHAEAGSAQVRQVEEYVEAHAAEPLDMATLARVTGHSVHSIYRAFRRHRARWAPE